MGLTIHYKLATTLKTPKEVRALVETMRQHALDMPFKEVGELKEFVGQEAQHDDRDDPDRWLKIQSGKYVEDGNYHYGVPPKHVIAFSTWPGDGCEEANFGFCLYPAFISANGRKRATKLNGWRWGSFCKTQYASNPECGGIQHFLRCHLGVVKMLDFAKSTGLVTVQVSDEGEYWEKRDIKALTQEVGEWNAFIAGFASVIRDAAETNGVHVESAITDFPNFEHLEAKGLDRLKNLESLLKGKGKRSSAIVP